MLFCFCLVPVVSCVLFVLSPQLSWKPDYRGYIYFWVPWVHAYSIDVAEKRYKGHHHLTEVAVAIPTTDFRKSPSVEFP